MAVPTFVAAGSFAEVVFPSPTTVAVPLPTGHTTNDILLLAVMSGAKAVKGVVTNANGGTWTEVTGSPLVPPDPDSGPQCTLYWSRDNGTQGNPTIGTSVTGNMLGVIVAYRGCETSGDPWDGTPATYQVTADADISTSVTFPGITTSVADVLYVMVLYTDENAGTANSVVGAFTNSNLASITERADQSQSANLGGGIAIVDGSKASAGAIGNSTATLTSGAQRRQGFGVGLKEPGAAPAPDLTPLLLLGIG